MSEPLQEIEEEVCDEEILNYCIRDMKCLGSLKIIGKRKHVYEARVPNHEKDDYIENRFPFALRTNNQIAFYKGLLDRHFICLQRNTTLILLVLIDFDSPLDNILTQQSLSRPLSVKSLNLLLGKFIIMVTFCVSTLMLVIMIGVAQELMRESFLLFMHMLL